MDALASLSHSLHNNKSNQFLLLSLKVLHNLFNCSVIGPKRRLHSMQQDLLCFPRSVIKRVGSHGDPLSCHRPTPKSLPEAIVFVYGWHFLSNEHSLNTDLCSSVVLHKGQCENTFKWRTSPNRCHISDTGAITLIHTLLWRFEDTCSLWECYAIMALWCIARPILADWLHKWHLGLISPSCTIFSRRYSSLNHQSESNHQPGTPPPNAFTPLRLFFLSVKYSQSFFSPHSRCSAPRAPSRRTGVWQEQLCRQ